MEAAKKTDNHMTSASAFVEGGVQDACDDSCSICLEDFSQSDPSTVTACKHEFHLQCILEWCQRSSNCPMCWQLISLKDAISQQLLEAVEEEREIRCNRLRKAAIFRQPGHTLQIPADASDLELEQHIFQHLAAAAAMRRSHHIFRREGSSNWSSSQGHRPFFIFSAPNAPGDNSVLTTTNPELAAVSPGSTSLASPNSADAQVSAVSFSGPHTHQASVYRQSPRGSQETDEQPELQSFSESIRSRLNSWSMRYKESISRNTRGWKERLFARNPSISEVGSEVQREVNAGIASVSRTLSRLNTRGNNGSGHASESSYSGSRSDTDHS